MINQETDKFVKEWLIVELNDAIESLKNGIITPDQIVFTNNGINGVRRHNGKKITKRMQELKLTKGDMVKKLGISYKSVVKMMNARFYPFSQTSLLKTAEALELSAMDFIIDVPVIIAVGE